MSWNKVPPSKKLVTAIANFTSTKFQDIPYGLHFEVGESLQVLEWNAGWYRGFKSSDPSVLGVFPDNFVEHRKCLTQGLGLLEPAPADEDRVLSEMKASLKDWMSHIREIYPTDADRARLALGTMSLLMELLMEYRHETCTRQRRNELKHKLAAQADRLNRSLGLPLVPRRAGVSIDASELSLAELLNAHETSAERMEKQKRSSDFRCESVLLTFESVKFSSDKASEPMMLYLYLYNKSKSEPVSEKFICEISNSELKSTRAVFTGLGSEDMTSTDILLVGELYRQVPITSVKKGRMLLESKRLSQSYRRPAGGCVMETSILRNLKYDSKKSTLTLYSINEDKFSPEYIRKNTGTGGTSIGELAVELSLAAEADLAVHKSSFTPKIGFADVIHPGESRNDLYIELEKGDFERGPKSSGKNIEVTVDVVGPNGNQVKDSISPGCGVPRVTTFRSCVYYHNNQPRWAGDCCKVILPVGDFLESHLVFRVYHGSKTGDDPKLHSFGFLRPHEVCDGLHTLILYKPLQGDAHRVLEEKLKTPHNYLMMPSIDKEHNPSTRNQHVTKCGRDTIQIRTALKSTQHTHNALLRSFLGWRDLALPTAIEKMTQLEQQLSSPNSNISHDVILFLSHVLDCEFGVLQHLCTNAPASETALRTVLSLLAHTLLLTQSRAFRGFRAVLDEYRTGHFCGPRIYQDLERAISLSCAISPPPIAVLQVLPELCEFYTQSYQQFVKDNKLRWVSVSHTSDIRALITSLAAVLKQTTKQILPAQKTILESLPKMFAALFPVLSSAQLAEALTSLLIPLTQRTTTDLNESQLACLLNVLKLTQPANVLDVEQPQLDNTDIHFALRPEVLRLMRSLVLPHIQKRIHSTLSVPCLNLFLAAVYRAGSNHGSAANNLSFCAVEVLRPLLDLVLSVCSDPASPHTATGSLGRAGGMSASTNPHTPKTPNMPPGVKLLRSNSSISSFSGYSTPSIERSLLTCFLCVLRLLDDQHYKLIISSCNNTLGLQHLLCRVLSACCLAVEDYVYPSDWASMKISASSDLLRAMQPFAQTLRNDIRHENLAELNQHDEQSLNQLWQSYFTFSFRFILQSCLDIRHYRPGSSYQQMLRSCNLRAMMATEISEMWDCLDPSLKYYHLHGLTPLVLRAALLPEPDVRRCLLQLLLDMLLVALQTSNAGYKTVCDTIIDTLNHEVLRGEGDKEFGDLLLELTSTSRLSPFVRDVNTLLNDLIEYRNVREQHGSGHFRHDILASTTYNLMKTYEQRGRVDLAVEYCSSLSQLHSDAKHFTEAGICSLYSVELRGGCNNLPVETPEHNKAIDLLSKAQSWELSLPLITQMSYEREQQGRLQMTSTLLKLKANLLDQIESEERLCPSYYCIQFCGTGFPSVIANKTFVKRGSAFDKLADIQEKLRNEFPGVVIGNFSTVEIPPDKRGSNQLYIGLSFFIKPEPDASEMMSGADESYRKWRQYNQIQRFTLDSKFHDPKKDPQNEFKTLHVKRYILTLADDLPHLLRWSEVTSSRFEILSPVEVAIDQTQEATAKLVTERVAAEKKPDRVQGLTRCLSGMVEAAVSGGIRMYLEAFFDDDSNISTGQRDQLSSALSVELKEMDVALKLHRKLTCTSNESVNPTPNQLELQTHLEKTLQQLNLDFHQKVLGDQLTAPRHQKTATIKTERSLSVDGLHRPHIRILTKHQQQPQQVQPTESAQALTPVLPHRQCPVPRSRKVSLPTVLERIEDSKRESRHQLTLPASSTPSLAPSMSQLLRPVPPRPYQPPVAMPNQSATPTSNQSLIPASEAQPPTSNKEAPCIPIPPTPTEQEASKDIAPRLPERATQAPPPLPPRESRMPASPSTVVSQSPLLGRHSPKPPFNVPKPSLSSSR